MRFLENKKQYISNLLSAAGIPMPEGQGILCPYSKKKDR